MTTVEEQIKFLLANGWHRYSKKGRHRNAVWVSPTGGLHPWVVAVAIATQATPQ